MDAAIWNNVVTAARRYAKPWDDPPADLADPGPSEADLLELVVDRPAPAGDARPPALTRGAAKVEVLGHHRHALAAEAASVRVLLRHALGASPDDGAELAVGFTAMLPRPWPPATRPRVAGDPCRTAGRSPTRQPPLRSPAYSVHPRTARAVTFGLDLSAAAAGTPLVLVAVASSTVDTAAFTGATLHDLVLRSRCAAARAVRVV